MKSGKPKSSSNLVSFTYKETVMNCTTATKIRAISKDFAACFNALRSVPSAPFNLLARIPL